MTNNEQHWAAKYIGRSYGEVGMCWGLVRMVCVEHLGIQMPHIAVGSQELQAAAIREASFRGGWRRMMGARPIADDIVVMMGAKERHVGFAAHDGAEIGILHALGHVTPEGAVGEVVFDTWPEMIRKGFHSFEFWRKVGT